MRIIHLPAIVALALASGPALAHPKLTTASPAPNATVAPTTSVRLVFSEGLVPAFTAAEVTRVGGRPTKMPGSSSVGADRKSLVVKFARPLPRGAYRIDWHAVSVDTHRVKGGYAFRIG